MGRKWRRAQHPTTLGLEKLYVEHNGLEVHLTGLYLGHDRVWLYRDIRGIAHAIDLKDNNKNRAELVEKSIATAQISTFAWESKDAFVKDTEKWRKTGKSDKIKAFIREKKNAVFKSDDPAEVMQLGKIQESLDVQTAQNLEDVKEKLEAYRKKHYRFRTKKRAFDPPPAHLAKYLCLNSWPQFVAHLRVKFKSVSHRRSAGRFLKFTKDFLKKHNYLRRMVKKAYPHLSARVVRDLCKGIGKRRSFIHIDHYLPVCPDEPFHFVVMFAIPNMKFGYAHMTESKALYVSEEMAWVFDETAKEFLSDLA